MKVNLYYNDRNAIRNGVDEGVHIVDVPADALSAEERAWLADNLHLHNSDYAFEATFPCTAEALVSAVKAEVAQIAKRAAQIAAEKSAATEAWLQIQDADLVHEFESGVWEIRTKIYEGKPDRCWGDSIDKDDPRVVARWPRLETRRDAKVTEQRQKWAIEKQAAKEREAAAAAAKAAAEERETAARNEWIAAHGSARLRRLVAENIECAAVYRDERLALDRPEWRYDDNSIRGAAEEIRNASEEALAILDEARKTATDAKLVYWVADEETDDDGEFEYEEFRGAVCVATFLDRQIVFRPPAEIVRT